MAEEEVRKSFDMKGKAQLGLGIKEEDGRCHVTDVHAGSAALDAGVEVGWHFHSVAGEKVRNYQETVKAVKAAVASGRPFHAVFMRPKPAGAAPAAPPPDAPATGSVRRSPGGRSRGIDGPSPAANAPGAALSLGKERQVYVEFCFEIRSLVFSSPKALPSMTPRPPVFRVRWWRGHNGQGDTPWRPPSRDPDTGEWRVEWPGADRAHPYFSETLTSLHVPVVGNPKAPPPKQMHLTLWMARNVADEKTHEEIRTIAWPLQYNPADEKKRKTGSLTIRREGSTDPLGKLNLTYTMHLLDRESSQVLEARERRQQRNTQRKEHELALSGVSMMSAEPQTGDEPVSGSWVSAAPTQPPPQQHPPPALRAAPAYVEPPADPYADPAFLAEEEELKALIYHAHGELFRLSSQVRAKRRRKEEIQQRRKVLHDDFAELRREIEQQVANREKLQVRLHDEKQLTEAMRRKREYQHRAMEESRRRDDEETALGWDDDAAEERSSGMCKGAQGCSVQ